MVKYTHFIEFNPYDSKFIISEPHGHKACGYVAPRKEIDNILLSISDRIKEDTKPFPTNAKIYLGKTCKLERSRIKAIFDSSSFSKTRVAEYADIIVLDTMQGYMNSLRTYFLNEEKINIITQALINKGLQSAADSLLLHAGFSKSVSICYGISSFDQLLNNIGISIEQTEDWYKSYYIFNEWGDNKTVDILNNIVLCSLNKTAQILDSKAFNGDILQKDRIIIDSESYDSYREMAYSKQIDDTLMLANLIDNCNIKKSHYYINLLAIDNILFGSGKLAANIKDETYKYLEDINKRHFNIDLSIYGVKYVLPRIAADKEYKDIPQTKINEEKYVLHLLQNDLSGYGGHWLEILGYEIIGLKNVNIKSKIKSDDVLYF